MDRLRYVIGFVIGAFFIISSFLHSILGWKQLSGRLAEVNAPRDLIDILALGWHFGGAAMFAFGCILLVVFARFLRDQSSSLRVAGLIALLYVAFGMWACVASKAAFFAVMFVLPGLLLLVASMRFSVAPSINR